jgi:beta-glucanase (GH16 family)
MGIDPNNLAGTATQTFDDEFNTLSLWNGASGKWATTFWYDSTTGNGDSLASNGEQEWYINSNYAPTASIKPWTVDSSGVLHITAAPASSATSALINGYQYTSGELNTYPSFSQTYGFFEVRAKLPTGQGFWPAFWLLPTDGSWPPELDVMESLGKNLIYTTVHSATAAGNQTSQSSTAIDTTQWHTYGVDWEKDYITWYVDGQAVYKVATPADMNKPMYMVLDLAVGGAWPGNANSSTNFANDMQVDWVRAYSALPASATTPAAAPKIYASTLLAADGATTLSATPNWTSAAVLSTGQVVMTAAQNDGWGSHVGVAALYNAATGVEAAGVGLNGYTPAGAAMSPQITVLSGGYWEVSYTGVGAPVGFEVYNASGQVAFIDNQYTAGTPTFAPLDTGGSVISDPAWGRFAVTSANGQINWFSEAKVNGQLAAPSQIQALSNGGFVFDYTGSTQLDVFSVTGAQVATAHLGAAASAFAMATAELPGGGFAAAWLSTPADGSFNEKLTFETFDSSGNAVTAAVSVATDADPWHTQMKVLPTGQPSEALLLWSQGGAIWTALANGTSIGAAKALGAGALDTFTETSLSDGKVVLTWVQKDAGVSDVWAEVLDPATMTLTQHLLGAGDGDAHVVATANGGFAVSWQNGAAIEGVGYHGDGAYGQAITVSGDFLGLDSSGHVVALGHATSGAATLQHYTLGIDPLTGV